jgi:preprotein translocase subunit SecE
MQKVISFSREVVIELKKVTWPKRNEVINYLGLVIAISAIIASFVGIIDFSLTKGFEKLLIN